MGLQLSNLFGPSSPHLTIASFFLNCSSIVNLISVIKFHSVYGMSTIEKYCFKVSNHSWVYFYRLQYVLAIYDNSLLIN